MLPNRKEFFEKTGLKFSKIVQINETSNDQFHVIVKAIWSFHFEKSDSASLDVEVPSTYVLRKTNDSMKIIFQLDHEDLMEKAKAQGWNA